MMMMMMIIIIIIIIIININLLSFVAFHKFKKKYNILAYAVQCIQHINALDFLLYNIYQCNFELLHRACPAIFVHAFEMTVTHEDGHM
jgi:hypothetical protein